MQPTAARSSRSSVIYPIAPLTSAYVQPQPQRVVYAPITTLQPTRTLQPNYIHARNQNNVRQVTPIQTEVSGKIAIWPVKNRVVKNQQYCQHQFIHPSNPVMICKQPINTFYPQTQPGSFVLSPNFPPNPYGESYSHPNIPAVPQPYYKAPDQPSNLYPNQPAQFNSYYLAASNATNYQAVNLNSNYDQSTIQQYKAVSTYSNSQIPVPVYPNMRMGLVINESSNEKIDLTTVSATNKLVNNVVSSTELYNSSNEKNQVEEKPEKDDHVSETSSTSFDFTIEAEKMVSALCDVKSPKNPNQENDGEKKNEEEGEENWLLSGDDESEKLNKSVGTQTQKSTDKLSELMRKTALWGCVEAETILKSARYSQDSKYTWLTNLSTATKTAITKSSGSFPVFGGDRILVHDLINALLRISNGWLALDNYLNKQYYPSLEDKYDMDLNQVFQIWEGNTQDLLKSIVQTFQKIEKSTTFFDPEQKPESLNLSFPGDVSMYTRCDLFDPYASHITHQQSISTIGLSPVTQSTYSSSYFSQAPNFHYVDCQQSIKESRLRTKWTITENTSLSNTTPKQEIRKTRNNVSFHRSLNEEFCRLKSKVMKSESSMKNESGSKLEFSPTKNPFTFSKEESESKSETIHAVHSDALFYQKSVHSKIVGVEENPVYLGKSSSNEFELVPKKKMTLVSQIEPNVNESSSHQGMTAHLSAWFASMRNPEKNQAEKGPRININRQDISRSALDLSRQLKMDANKQLLTLKNMQSIQSAPWSAINMLIGKKNQKNPEECESTEDQRVYMKPGSYNVPKKRHQKKAKSYQTFSKSYNRLNKSQKETYSVPSSLPSLSSVSTDSPSHSNNQSFSSNNSKGSPPKKERKEMEESFELDAEKNKESTWKAACASAEILLEALNISKQCEAKESDKFSSGEEAEVCQKLDKTFETIDSSSEGSVEDLNSASVTENLKSRQKGNVKTDSWLMKTFKLKNVDEQDASSDVQKGDEKLETQTSFSETRQLSYSDITKREFNKVQVKSDAKTTNVCKTEGKKSILKRNLKTSQVVKSNEKLNKWMKVENEEEDSNQLKKKKKLKIKEGMLSFNPKKKPGLSPDVVSKLENIHQTISQMEESFLLKAEDQKKFPIYLETIGQKLRNRNYVKMENVWDDFRKLVDTAKVFYKNNESSLLKIETVHAKLEQLFEECFRKISS